MLNFLKKVRQTVLTEGKMSKYLKYALGEIILVVIGILIALQIKTWNENYSNNKEGQRYLLALKGEFENNKEILKSVMVLNQMNTNAALAILENTGPDEPEIDKIVFDSLLLHTIGSEIEFRPNNEIIEQVLSSGKLSLIKSAELRKTLLSWNSTLKKVRFQEAELSDNRFKLIDFLMQQINYRKVVNNIYGSAFGYSQSKFQTKNTLVLQSLEFENMLTTFVNVSYFADKRFVATYSKIDEILSQIEKEIKK
ncbi:MAG: hypothetical protein CMO01_11290 [Thalassobius sp.]|nr:hypothetical protein [Thalassovita sp.]